MIQRFRDKIPVICEWSTNCHIKEMEKNKFLVPKDLHVY